MLVKIGNVWVDPTKVISLHARYVTTTENCIELGGDFDSYAAIINNALQVQSYGGEQEEK